MSLRWATCWDGQSYPTWPVQPAPACAACGQPGRLYLSGAACDAHRAGPPPAETFPIARPAGGLTSALEHALTQWPSGRRCTSGDHGRSCPFPLDAALGDAIDHPSCSPAGQRALEAARHADTLRGTAAARAAVTGRGAAA